MALQASMRQSPMVAPTRAVLALQTPEVQAVALRLALGLLATLAVAVAAGGATGLDSVVVVLAALPRIRVMALMDSHSQATTRFCKTLLDTAGSLPFWLVLVNQEVAAQRVRGQSALPFMVGVVVLVPVEVLDWLHLPKASVAMAALAEVVAKLQAPLHTEAKAALVVAVEKEPTQAALAAQQSFAFTTKEPSCTTHLLNPTL